MKACRLFIWLLAITGILYPLAITALGYVLMPHQAKGSLIVQHNQVIGSKLIGQKFTAQEYFWPRPSATDYNSLPSAGSHLGPTSHLLQQLVAQRRQNFSLPNVPSDLLFSSGSGLDPHITPQAAYFQIPRVAQARSMDVLQLTQIVKQHIQTSYLGPAHVNVLMLNAKLDELKHSTALPSKQIETRRNPWKKI